jgi:hypothetical protein
MVRRPRRSSASFAAASVLVSLVGCASQTPEYPPAPPPPPRALTITAQRNQSQARQDKDKSDCQSMASGQATSSESWAQIFTACMGGRGYMVQ